MLTRLCDEVLIRAQKFPTALIQSIRERETERDHYKWNFPNLQISTCLQILSSILLWQNNGSDLFVSASTDVKCFLPLLKVPLYCRPWWFLWNLEVQHEQTLQSPARHSSCVIFYQIPVEETKSSIAPNVMMAPITETQQRVASKLVPLFGIPVICKILRQPSADINQTANYKHRQPALVTKLSESIYKTTVIQRANI